jgi:hypothetical protein
MAGAKRKRGEETGGGGARQSRDVGVSWYTHGQKKSVAQIAVHGVNQYVDMFDDDADGARAYDAAVALQNLQHARYFMGDSGAVKVVNNRVRLSKVRSRFLGVCWDKRDKKWKVQATYEGKQKFLGLYTDETAAAWAFDAYVIAKNINTDLNFPSAPGAVGHKTTKKGRTSRQRGVYWDKVRKKWRAEIRVDRKSKSLGYFVNEDDAGRAYDTAIRKHYPGERPKGWKRFNFPSADGDDAGSARGGASSSSAAVDEEKKEEEASSPEAEEPRAAAAAIATAIPGP